MHCRPSIPTRRWRTATLAGALGACFACAALAQEPRQTLRLVSETPAAASSAPLSAQELRATAGDAYLSAYPLALTAATRRRSTQGQRALGGNAARNQSGRRPA